jgi:uncharacterized repeat protein (TIGR03987 family)
MLTEVLISTILITLALVFYTIGVWAERLAGRLKPWHLMFFWGALIFDTAGTGMMMDSAGGLSFDIHGVTGALAILLMVIHALWATDVLLRKNGQAILNYRRFRVGSYSSGWFHA